MAGPALAPLRVHPGHEFEGFEILTQVDGARVLQARCACGASLGVADAAFAACPDCAGGGAACTRCGGTGEVVDHAALHWRNPDDTED
jgi:mannose/cellobiose epimerase-like protein (N-acyl-D-glucosamine 2-epimerase family)